MLQGALIEGKPPAAGDGGRAGTPGVVEFPPKPKPKLQKVPKKPAQKGVATRHANKATAEAAQGNHAEAARLATLAATAAANSGDQSRAANLTSQAAAYARLAATPAGDDPPC